MTELHCHILPGIDDGAKNVDVSLALLKLEAKAGINQIALTSHFKPEHITLDEFLEGRSLAYAELLSALENTDLNFNFKLGAEVYFSPQLSELDLRPLCIGDTDYMLLEFSTLHKPQFIDEVLYDIQCQGIVPLIAHVERYPYVMEDLSILYNWIDSGCYAHVNADTFLRSKKDAKFFCKLIKWDLVHFIATDTHSVDKRPPRMTEAFCEIEKLAGRETVEKLIQNADDIFNNYELDLCDFHEPKKSLGRWK